MNPSPVLLAKNIQRDAQKCNNNLQSSQNVEDSRRSILSDSVVDE
jgi:hypothetical protein